MLPWPEPIAPPSCSARPQVNTLGSRPRIGANRFIIPAQFAPSWRPVIGDAVLGLCGVIAARRLGAEQIIVLGRDADRIALARIRANRCRLRAR